jgi:hypothetical protein
LGLRHVPGGLSTTSSTRVFLKLEKVISVFKKLNLVCFRIPLTSTAVVVIEDFNGEMITRKIEL